MASLFIYARYRAQFICQFKNFHLILARKVLKFLIDKTFEFYLFFAALFPGEEKKQKNKKPDTLREQSVRVPPGQIE